MLVRFHLVVTAVLTLLAGRKPALAESIPYLLADAEPRTPSYPSQPVALGGRWLFAADDGVHGRELWSTDGTAGGTALVKDIAPGPGSGLVDPYAPYDHVIRGGSPRNSGGGFHPLGSDGEVVYFLADDGEHGLEPWVTDGTERGTRMLKDIDPGPGSSAFSLFSESKLFSRVGGLWLFAAYDAAHGQELWRTDGTTEGTSLVLDVRPGPEEGMAEPAAQLAAFPGRLFFWSRSLQDALELWISDGSTDATRLVKRLTSKLPNVWTWWDNSTPSSRFYFSLRPASQGDAPPELWTSNGTADGTMRIDPGWPVSACCAVRDRLYFTVDHPTYGREPWTSDGTQSGTVLLKDIAPGAASSNSGFGILGPLGARAFFIADDGTGRDIWATDGQPGGTEKVTRFGDVDWPVVTWQEHLLVAVRGDELWATDGTEAGTRRILDSEPVTMESFQVCDSGATLAFVGTVGQAHGLWIADDLLGGTPTRLDLPSSLCVDIPFLTCEAGMWLAAVDGELWRADPDTLELSRIADVNQRLTESFFADFSAGNANPSDWATRRTIHGDLAYFTRAAPICCAEGYDSFGPLWVTDGTSDGTRQVWPDPGEPCEQQIPLRIVATAGSRVFFEGSQGLWVSDGTPDSTHLLVNTTFGEYVLSPLGRLFALGGWPSIILWSTDGTPEGSGAVREWSQGDIDIDLIASLGERVVFTTRASDQKLQLWISDGTEAGTRVLAQLGDGHSVTAIGQTDAGYFFGAEDSRSRLLWVTDGTEAGTRLVRTWPSRLLNWWGHELPFLYLKYEDRWQLWQIVGQDVQLVTERAGNIASVRVPLKRIGDRLVFLETNAEQRTALWVTDGTEAGTHRLLETEDAIELFGTANDLVWFWRAGELWATDGTPGGTRLEHAFADVRTDPAYSRWPELTKSEITGAPAGQGGEHGTTPYPVIWPKKGLVLFSGDDGVHGYEPWALRLSSRDAPRFLRADSNADATVDISDPVRTLERLFLDGSAPACRAASDANADGLLDISDAVYTLAYLFLGGAAPSAPFPGCGPGGLPADPLDCASPPAGCP